MFYKRTDSIDKYRNNCIQCHKKNTIKNTLKYKEQNINKQNTTEIKYCPRCRQLKNGKDFSLCMFRKDGLYDYCKECSKKKAKIRSNTPKTRFGIYKRSAEKRKLSFKLSYKTFYTLVHSACKYCGKEMDSIYLHGIDRVNNNTGYTEKNCVSCCALCNNMKKTSTLEMFLEQVKNIYMCSIQK